MKKKMPKGRPFTKGQIGNPKGRPKKESCIPDILREIGDTQATDAKNDPVIDPVTNKVMTFLRFTLLTVYRKAALGDMEAVKFIADRTEGKVADKVELTQKRDEFEGKTAEELDHYAATGVWPDKKQGEE